MKKISLKKYGFERFEQEDFHDDGNNFKGYKLGELSFSYLRSDDMIYFSGRGDYKLTGIEKLNYEEYSTLPHYKYLDMLNGFPVSSLTEEHFEKLVEYAKAFIEEYKNYLETLEIISFEDVYEKCCRLAVKRDLEYREALQLVKNNIDELFNLSGYAYKEIKDCIDTLKREANMDIKETALFYSKTQSNARYFMTKGFDSLLKPSYYFTRLNNLLSK